MQKIETFRFTSEEIDKRYHKMKSLITDGNRSVFRDLCKRKIRDVIVQPISHCGVGCAHCSGWANNKKQPVLSSEELAGYLKMVNKYYDKDLQVFFTGIYGEPLAYLEEENGVDYYTDLVNTVLNFDKVQGYRFVTSGYHLQDLEKTEKLFKRLKKIEENKMENTRKDFSQFGLVFSIDAFHEKKISHDTIRNAIKVMRKVYKNDWDVINKLGFNGQSALSKDKLEGGGVYLINFLLSLDSIFDTNTVPNDFTYMVNPTKNGRVKIKNNKEREISEDYALTKSSDGALVFVRQNGNKRYEYELIKDINGNIDLNNFEKVFYNTILDKLSLKIRPSKCDNKELLLKEFCKDDESIPKIIRHKSKIAFEDLVAA